MARRTVTGKSNIALFHCFKGRGHLVVDELNTRTYSNKTFFVSVLLMVENNHFGLIPIYVNANISIVEKILGIHCVSYFVFLMENDGSHRYQQ